MATTKKSTQKASSGKRKAPAAKTHQAMPKEAVVSQITKDLWGVGCLALAVLAALSWLDGASALSHFFSGLVGPVGQIALPIALLLCAIALLTHGDAVAMRVICSLSFALLISALSHLILSSTQVDLNWEMFSILYRQGKEGASGGVLGGTLALFFTRPGRLVGWGLIIMLLLITLPASVNLTLTGLLRAINKHREELNAQNQAQRREPAEVLVEKAIQHRQDRQERRQERRLDRQERMDRRQRPFEFDLAVDGEEASSAVAPKPVSSSAGDSIQLPNDPLEQIRPSGFARKHLSEIDIPVDDPIRLRPEAAGAEAEELPPVAFREPAPIQQQHSEIDSSASAPKAPAAPAVKPLPSDKVKSSDARQAAAEIEQQIESSPAAAKANYSYPPIDLLDKLTNNSVDASTEMRENTRRLQEKLACFNIDAQIVNVTRGPNVTMYELQLAQGVRLSKLTGLSDDIALELGASGVRISAIPDKNSMVGIEVPNKQVSTVSIREVLDSRDFRNAKSKISFAVGKDINGNCVIGDIAKMPHVLIAGTTGSGKSVCTNSILISLLYKASPDEVKLIVVDPKMVEFGIYNGIPHLLIPVVTDAKKAAGALQWAVTEMMRRYRSLSEAGVRDIESYNKLAATEEGLEPLPKLVVVIDELADLMLVAGKEVEEAICRIAQMGRASGVHLVIATQRPSADVITGLMKANIPSRIALVVSSAMESRIILDSMGAEKLIGRGDMLYAPLGKGKKRVQGCYIDETEVQRVIDFVKANGSPDYNDEVQQEIDLRASQSGKNSAPSSSATPSNPSGATDDEGDEMLPAAVDVILETGLCSVSLLQRRLKLGYARAARIVDEMEERGLVGPFEGSKPRQLLITKEQWSAMQNGTPLDLNPEEEEPQEELSENEPEA